MFHCDSGRPSSWTPVLESLNERERIVKRHWGLISKKRVMFYWALRLCKMHPNDTHEWTLVIDALMATCCIRSIEKQGCFLRVEEAHFRDFTDSMQPKFAILSDQHGPHWDDLQCNSASPSCRLMHIYPLVYAYFFILPAQGSDSPSKRIQHRGTGSTRLE